MDHVALIAGRYVPEAVIASGASATVYVARSVATQAQVALKVLHEQYLGRSDLVERFEREARTLRKFFHDHIVRYYDHGRDHIGRPFLVMEYLKGWPGGDLIGSSLSLEEKIQLLGQICSAVQYANDRDVIHRDLKWSNVIVTTEDDSEDMILKVIDFGVIKLLGNSPKGPRLTTAGAVMGSPHTVSPEQIRDRPLDARSDLYAIGCMAYELFTSRKPFDGKTAQAICINHLRQTPASPTDVDAAIPEELSSIVMRALEKNPADRYEGAGAFFEAMSEVPV